MDAKIEPHRVRSVTRSRGRWDENDGGGGEEKRE